MTITHTAALSTGGSTCRLAPGSRYANDPRVSQDAGVFTVTAGDTTYQVHRCDDGWGVYRDDGAGALPVAGDGFATGISTADQAIGSVIGDARG